MKKYFVSYFYKEKGTWGMGNSIIGIDRPIGTEETIRAVEKKLKSKGMNGLVLLNFIELSETDE